MEQPRTAPEQARRPARALGCLAFMIQFAGAGGIALATIVVFLSLLLGDYYGGFRATVTVTNELPEEVTVLPVGQVGEDAFMELPLMAGGDENKRVAGPTARVLAPAESTVYHYDHDDVQLVSFLVVGPGDMLRELPVSTWKRSSYRAPSQPGYEVRDENLTGALPGRAEFLDAVRRGKKEWGLPLPMWAVTLQALALGGVSALVLLVGKLMAWKLGAPRQGRTRGPTSAGG